MLYLSYQIYEQLNPMVQKQVDYFIGDASILNSKNYDYFILAGEKEDLLSNNLNLDLLKILHKIISFGIISHLNTN